ncbi:MAG: class I SAM-dependent methyltransferase [Calditrichaeota bacterium]|nr:class I SAM-dependent methyltransferase [Calditrichota bacterium]
MGHLKYTEFYSEFANDYDSMTKDSSRWAKVQGTYIKLFGDLLPERILDAGCGSGGEMVALSKLGITCFGVDGSAEMIDQARQKAIHSGSNAEFLVDDISELSKIENGSVDLVICRGNTLPHLRISDSLGSAFSAFSRVTRSGGRLVLQWLNYDMILKDKKRLVGVSGDNNEVFTRFYDFISPEEVVFNLLIQNYDEKWKSKWISTPLTPWTSDTVLDTLKRNGWQDVEIYGDIGKSEFKPDNSNNIVVLARKN